MQVGENKMSQQQSTVLNGTSGEVAMAFKDPPQPQQMVRTGAFGTLKNIE